jgi:sulfate permease, SulP family
MSHLADSDSAHRHRRPRDERSASPDPTPPPALFTGLRAAWQAGYGWSDLRQDVLAGITVGIVAVPLAMALAIAIGVAPQHGLYTAIVAGVVTALAGGSRFNVSGPTAAFVVILHPIVQQHGLGGLLIATMMAGLILVGLGVTRLGALIRFVPHPVVLGFTAGIGLVIAMLQLPDFLGLTSAVSDGHPLETVGRIFGSLTDVHTDELAIGVLTLAVLLLWPRLRSPVPAPLVALLVASIAAWAASRWGGIDVATIASRFTWTSPDGDIAHGIPPLAPTLMVPWGLPGPDGAPLVVTIDLIRSLLGPALAIAVLGAIESLLCATIADGLTRTRHNSNGELIGQGLGNMITPLFGGITATAAIARTATSIRSGARSPIAAIVHALVVLVAVLLLAPLLGWVPMAALAALLIIIAWNMADAHLFARTVRTAPRSDVVILLVCFGLTVVFDMVIAVAVGIGLAGALFIGRMASLTRADRVPLSDPTATEALSDEIVIYDVNGPLFFAAVERAVASIRVVDPGVRVIVLDMADVPSMDATALTAVHTLVEDLQGRGISLVFVGLVPRLIVKLRRAGLRRHAGRLAYASSLGYGIRIARRWVEAGQGNRTIID